jgi:DNA-binding NtrC family response regulator
LKSLKYPIRDLKRAEEFVHALETLRRDKSMPVWVIESNFIVKKLIGNILMQMGFINVNITMNGYDCLKGITLSSTPPLILYSLSNGDLSGTDFMSYLPKLREKSKFKLIVISNPVPMNELEKLGELGADGFVFKPLDIARIVDALKLAGVW